MPFCHVIFRVDSLHIVGFTSRYGTIISPSPRSPSRLCAAQLNNSCRPLLAVYQRSAYTLKLRKWQWKRFWLRTYAICSIFAKGTDLPSLLVTQLRLSPSLYQIIPSLAATIVPSLTMSHRTQHHYMYRPFFFFRKAHSSILMGIAERNTLARHYL
jgi:hypothetical protein